MKKTLYLHICVGCTDFHFNRENHYSQTLATSCKWCNKTLLQRGCL